MRVNISFHSAMIEAVLSHRVLIHAVCATTIAQVGEDDARGGKLPVWMEL